MYIHFPTVQGTLKDVADPRQVREMCGTKIAGVSQGWQSQ